MAPEMCLNVAGLLSTISSATLTAHIVLSFSESVVDLFNMSNADRVVLCLGGAGTVGSGIVKALLDKGKIPRGPLGDIAPALQKYLKHICLCQQN